MIRQVRVGNVLLGGGSIAVQSMTTTKTSDVERSVAQILSLRDAGRDIVRVAVADEGDARALHEICGRVGVPVVADVHFYIRGKSMLAQSAMIVVFVPREKIT